MNCQGDVKHNVLTPIAVLVMRTELYVVSAGGVRPNTGAEVVKLNLTSDLRICQMGGILI